MFGSLVPARRASTISEPAPTLSTAESKPRCQIGRSALPTRWTSKPDGTTWSRSGSRSCACAAVAGTASAAATSASARRIDDGARTRAGIARAIVAHGPGDCEPGGYSSSSSMPASSRSTRSAKPPRVAVRPLAQPVEAVVDRVRVDVEERRGALDVEVGAGVGVERRARDRIGERLADGLAYQAADKAVGLPCDLLEQADRVERDRAVGRRRVGERAPRLLERRAQRAGLRGQADTRAQVDVVALGAQRRRGSRDERGRGAGAGVAEHGDDLALAPGHRERVTGEAGQREVDPLGRRDRADRHAQRARGLERAAAQARVVCSRPPREQVGEQRPLVVAAALVGDRAQLDLVGLGERGGDRLRVAEGDGRELVAGREAVGRRRRGRVDRGPDRSLARDVGLDERVERQLLAGAQRGPVADEAELAGRRDAVVGRAAQEDAQVLVAMGAHLVEQGVGRAVVDRRGRSDLGEHALAEGLRAQLDLGEDGGADPGFVDGHQGRKSAVGGNSDAGPVGHDVR